MIIDYLEDTASGPSLYPEDPAERARVRLLCRMVDLYILPELVVLFRGRENPDAVPSAMARLGPVLDRLQHFRRDDDLLAVGDRFSAADATMIPIFFFFDAFAKPFGTDRLLDAQPALKAWWDRAKASELGARALAEQGEGLKALLAGR